MFANQVKGRLSIVLSILVILLGVFFNYMSNDTASKSKGIDVSFEYVDNGKRVETPYGGTIGERPELAPAAKGYKTLSYVLYVGGAVGLIYGIVLCLKKDDSTQE